MGLTAVRTALGATMPEVALEIEDCLGEFVVTIHSVTAIGNSVFTLVGYVLNANPYRRSMVMVWRLQQTVFLPM